MKIEKIRYGKSFQIHDGLWEKIGVEIILDDTDTRENARLLANETVKYIFEKNNPGLLAESVRSIEQLPVIQIRDEY